jgi:hypothetical protein
MYSRLEVSPGCMYFINHVVLCIARERPNPGWDSNGRPYLRSALENRITCACILVTMLNIKIVNNIDSIATLFIIQFFNTSQSYRAPLSAILLSNVNCKSSFLQSSISQLLIKPWFFKAPNVHNGAILMVIGRCKTWRQTEEFQGFFFFKTVLVNKVLNDIFYHRCIWRQYINVLTSFNHKGNVNFSHRFGKLKEAESFHCGPWRCMITEESLANSIPIFIPSVPKNARNWWIVLTPKLSKSVYNWKKGFLW